MDYKVKITRKLFTWLLLFVLCLAIPMTIAPKGAMAEPAPSDKLVQTEFSNESWEIVNKDQTDVSEIKEASTELTGLQFTSQERFGGQIVSKNQVTGDITIEMDFSGTMDGSVAYTYMYIGRKSKDAVSQDNWADAGIVLGFHIRGVALYDDAYTEDMGEHWRCRFDAGVGNWRPIYSAGAYRTDSFSYKIVITESELIIYGEWNKTSDPAGRVAIDNAGYALSNGYVAISNRYSTYTTSSFKVNNSYTSIADWDKYGDVTFAEGNSVPSSVSLKDVDNVKSSTTPETDNPMLVSKFVVSTQNVEENAEVFSLNLDVQTIRPRSESVRFLIGLSENNDNPSLDFYVGSVGVSDGGACCYFFDGAYTTYNADDLPVSRFIISIKGYQNGDVVVSYECPKVISNDCVGHSKTFSGVDVNGKIGIQTITSNDAPQSQGITITKLSSAESLFSGYIVKEKTVTLTNGVDTQTETTSSDKYILPKTFTQGKTLIGWLDSEDNLQKPGKEITLSGDAMFTAVEVDLGFALIDGASVRIDTVGNTSGIRFTAIYNTSAMAEISEYVLEKGMLLVRTSAFEVGTTDAQKSELFIYKGTLAHAFENVGVVDGELTKHAYAIYNIKSADYATAISARAYIKINYADGVDYIYTTYTEEHNSRSIKTVATNLKGTEFYNGLTVEQQGIIDLYAGQ